MNDDLSKQQEGMERLGLMAASLYGGMVREGVPSDAAERIATQIVTRALELSMRQQAAQAEQSDPTLQILKLLRGGRGA